MKLLSVTFILGILFGMSLVPRNAFGQTAAPAPAVQAPAVEATSEEETLDVPKGRRFVYLTLGIEYDEKVSNAPELITFRGDYKRVAGVTFNKDSNSLHFVPRNEGIASLTLYDKKNKKIGEYRLIVRKSKLDAVARELQSLLGDIEGITVRIINNKVLVDGQVLLPADMARIVNVVAQFGDQARL